MPPSVYRKAKQAPEERREIVLVKELEAILSKESLTANASKDGMLLSICFFSCFSFYFIHSHFSMPLMVNLCVEFRDLDCNGLLEVTL